MKDVLHIAGGCHCGLLRFELHWPRAEAGTTADIPARKCGCSFCTRIDGTWTSHPNARLRISENPEMPATRYRFGTGTADFLFCSQCGVVPVAMCGIDGRVYAVVNVNTFDAIELPEHRLVFSDTDFEGESLRDRLARREARWIGDVELD